MAEYKATCKLRSTEEVFAALEDNMVTLSTMKASRFFAVFEKDITHWEKTLSLVSETIELVLTVSPQRVLPWYHLSMFFPKCRTPHPQVPLTNLILLHCSSTFLASQPAS